MKRTLARALSLSLQTRLLVPFGQDAGVGYAQHASSFRHLRDARAHLSVARVPEEVEGDLAKLQNVAMKNQITKK